MEDLFGLVDVIETESAAQDHRTIDPLQDYRFDGRSVNDALNGNAVPNALGPCSMMRHSWH
jgi:hypothetical protein